ncbi:hypothetical protein LINPERPRIM_LOCUS15055 [Linum perenne]
MSSSSGSSNPPSSSFESSIPNLGNTDPRFLKMISSLDQTSTLRFSLLFKGC